MSSKKQLDDKHQKILRKLLQLPENKKCFDCPEKGPFYACTTLGTFVCTSCSGIHREFQHHVKSISMASFKPEEVQFLEEMGNGRARDIWLATWTPSDYPEPDSSDKSRIREFMKLKYERKRWYAKPGSAPRGTTNGASPRNPKKSRSKHRAEDTPRVEPIESILGKDIPPISITHHVNLPPNDGARNHSPQQPAKPKDPFLVNWDAPAPAVPGPSQTMPGQFPTPAPSKPAGASASVPAKATTGLESVFTQPHPPSTVWPPPTAGTASAMGSVGMGTFMPGAAPPSQQASPQVFQHMSPHQQQQYLLMQQQWIQQQQYLLQQRMVHMTLGGTPQAGPGMVPMGAAAGGVAMGTNPFLAGPYTPATPGGVLAPSSYNAGPASSGTSRPGSTGASNSSNNQKDPFADLSPLPPKPAGSTATASSAPPPSRGPGVGMGAASSPFFQTAPTASSPTSSPSPALSPALPASGGSNPFAPSSSSSFGKPAGTFPPVGATGSATSNATGFNPFGSLI